MGKGWYSVGVGTEPTKPANFYNELLENVLEALEKIRGIEGPVVTYGALSMGPGARMSIQASDPTEALEAAITALEKAFVDAGIPDRPIAYAEVMTEEQLDQQLAEPATEFAGVAELAEILGVSKQRVYELRSRPDFPKPIAELAAGPVWNRASLNHFIANWTRKPGRPRFQLVNEGRDGDTTEATRIGLSDPTVRSAMKKVKDSLGKDSLRGGFGRGVRKTGTRRGVAARSTRKRKG